MVFVKVRETYDLHTIANKMTVIGIHTPKPDIIKANFPGLLMQCKAYRPVSADVRIACASVLPLDPQGIGLTEGSVAPEDVFNPILYKACSNFGMSQIEARIAGMVLANQGSASSTSDVSGNTATVDVDSVTDMNDEFPIYYGFLSNAHEFRHASPQSGLEMHNLKPLVYEVLYNLGDGSPNLSNPELGGQDPLGVPTDSGSKVNIFPRSIRGNAKPLPFINCTAYNPSSHQTPGFLVQPGGSGSPSLNNEEQDVPWINCIVGAVIIPPSRLHELFYRMVVEWTIEFSMIRPVSEITNWSGLTAVGGMTHYQNYDYASAKAVLTGSDETILKNDSSMVSSTVDINKVM